MTHLNYRVCLSADGKQWLVQGQKPSNYSWETVLTYGESMDGKAQAVEDAKMMARMASKGRIIMISVYFGGYAIAEFVDGEQYFGGEDE